MAKYFWTCIFLLGFCASNAQEILVIENIETEEKKVFKLPITVACKLDDGTEESFVIIDIKDDSLITKKYYNNLNIRNYHINEILIIRFKKKSDWIVWTSYLLSLTATAIIVPITINELFSQSSLPYPGTNNRDLAIVFGVPLSLISSAITIFLKLRLQKEYSNKKWRFYVE